MKSKRVDVVRRARRRIAHALGRVFHMPGICAQGRTHGPDRTRGASSEPLLQPIAFPGTWTSTLPLLTHVRRDEQRLEIWVVSERDQIWIRQKVGR